MAVVKSLTGAIPPVVSDVAFGVEWAVSKKIPTQRKLYQKFVSIPPFSATSPVNGEVFVYQNGVWVNQAIPVGTTVGSSISGGTANRVLYENSSNQLAESANLQFDGTNLRANSLSIGRAAGLTLDVENLSTFPARFKSGSGTPALILDCAGNNGGISFLENDVAKAALRTVEGTFFDAFSATNPFYVRSNHEIIFVSGGLGAANRLVVKTDGKIGINYYTPAAWLHVIGTGEQSRIGYDALNYRSETVDSSGVRTVNPVGASAKTVHQKDIELADGKNLLFGSTVGTMFGNKGSELLAFWGATPVTQRTDIGFLGDLTGGSIVTTLQDVDNGSGVADTETVNNNFTGIVDKINQIQQILLDLGITA
jgi:hypothetical protein